MPCLLIPSSFSQIEVWNTNTHTRDGKWKEEEDEGEARGWEGMGGEEEWKSVCKRLYVSGFNPCRLQLSANTVNPQRRWRGGKRRRQAWWSGRGRRKDEGRWNMWGKNKRKEMKKGRRHGERSNNQGKEGEKRRMKKENKRWKGKRAKKKTQVKKSKRKTEREDEGRKAGGSVFGKSADGRAEKCHCCGGYVSWSLPTKPNQQSVCATRPCSCLQERNPLVTMSYVRATRALSTVQLKHPGLRQ